MHPSYINKSAAAAVERCPTPFASAAATTIYLDRSTTDADRDTSQTRGVVVRGGDDAASVRAECGVFFVSFGDMGRYR